MRLQLLLMVAFLLPAQSLEDARMARGDDPRWADPAFDDTAWEIVARRRVQPMEDAKENRLWLRMQVTVPAGEPVAVLVHRCACELFLDGVRLGATGNLDLPRPDATGESRIFPIPAALAGRSAVLAVRQYRPPGAEGAGGLLASQRIRVLPVRETGLVAEQIRQTDEFLPFVRLAVLLPAFGALLAASVRSRRDPLILTMLVYVCAQTGSTAFSFAGSNYPDRVAWLWVAALSVVPTVALVPWLLAGLPIRAGWCAAALGAFLVIRLPWTVGLFLAQPAPWTPLAAAVFVVPSLVGLGMGGYAVMKAWRRSEWPMRLLLLAAPAVVFFNLSTRLSARGLLPALTLPLGRFSLNGDTLATLVFTIMVTVYIVRTGRERRAEEQRLRNEMESAQTVQALLLSRAMPAEVDAIYLPASEVGGDFYQAFTTPAGTLLAVGDVSGKGLQAAMRVSAIVGALRNRRSDEPAAVLAELNAVLVGSPGFTTCCCALFPAGGAPARVANAGHPAPIVDGMEVNLEPALPLGVVSEVEYTEQVVPGSVFTFVSDGVVEAENAQRELFGFDRTREISTKSAQEIADAAKAWGQTDDITVVTVRRNL